MLRVTRATPSHAECEAQETKLVEFTCVCCGLRTNVRCKVVGKPELVLTRTREGHWIDLARSTTKEALLLLMRPES